MDPYWDFDHADGWDATARRFDRVRVAVPGSEPIELRVRLARVDGADLVDLPPAEHVFRFTGGAPSAGDAYVPVPPRIVASPPLLVLALDLTGLSPGEHVLTTTSTGRDPDVVRVVVDRRAFFSLPVGDAGDPLAVRSATGLGRAEDRGELRPATAHRWRVTRNAWVQAGKLRGAYRPKSTTDVLAVTIFDAAYVPVATRWRELDRGEGVDPQELVGPAGLASLRAPGEHGDEARGFGLAFPCLVGLPSQPGPDGAHPVASPRSR